MISPETKDPRYSYELTDDDRYDEEARRKVEAEFVTSEVLREIRVSKYFDPAQLKAFDFSTKITNPKWLPRADFMRNLYLRSIERYGKEALVHLCITIGEYIDLHDFANITWIEDLADAINEGTLQVGAYSNSYEPGNYTERRIIRLYYEWLALPES